MNTFLRGRSLISLEKALALLLMFLSNHNENLTGKRYLQNVMNYIEPKIFSQNDLNNYGLIFNMNESQPSGDQERIDEDIINDTL